MIKKYLDNGKHQENMLFYYTIKEHTTSEIPKIKGSRFIGDVFPIEKKQDVERYLQQVRKFHHQATHRCYGYHLGIDKQKNIFDRWDIKPKEIKYDDNGEPTNTAAGPIKNILTHHNLQNTLLILTRYFGGTLLGIGGLIAAYTTIAKATIEKTTIIKVPLTKHLSISYYYSQVKTIYSFCKKHSITILKQDVYDNYLCAILEINIEIFENIKKELEALCLKTSLLDEN